MVQQIATLSMMFISFKYDFRCATLMYGSIIRNTMIGSIFQHGSKSNQARIIMTNVLMISIVVQCIAIVSALITMHESFVYHKGHYSRTVIQ